MLIIFHFPLFQLFFIFLCSICSFEQQLISFHLAKPHPGRISVCYFSRTKEGPDNIVLLFFLSFSPFHLFRVLQWSSVQSLVPVRRSATELHPELLFFLFGVGDEPRTSCLLGRHSTTELQPQFSFVLAPKVPQKYFLFRIHLRFMRLWVVLFVFLSLFFLYFISGSYLLILIVAMYLVLNC